MSHTIICQSMILECSFLRHKYLWSEVISGVTKLRSTNINSMHAWCFCALSRDMVKLHRFLWIQVPQYFTIQYHVTLEEISSILMPGLKHVYKQVVACQLSKNYNQEICRWQWNLFNYTFLSLRVVMDKSKQLAGMNNLSTRVMITNLKSMLHIVDVCKNYFISHDTICSG
jgi:hypothetical protein